MARVLITGSTGFIGSHLVPALLAGGDEVTCLVRRESSAEHLQQLPVRLAWGDVTDPESVAAAVRGQDVVFHLAGLVRAIRAEQFFEVNEGGVRNVLAACAQQPSPPVVVLASSLAAAGPSTTDQPRTENDVPQPVSYYGRSKLAGERVAREYADRVPVTIVRPPIVFGEADLATKEIFAPIARFGIHMVPSREDHRVSVVHADDLIQLLMLAAQRGQRLPVEGADSQDLGRGCYFAAAEKDPTYADLGWQIGQALERRRVLIVRVGAITVWSTAYMASTLSRLAGHPSYFGLDKAREARAGTWTCSAEAARRDLGYCVGAPLAQRLRQTARWYREHAWL